MPYPLSDHFDGEKFFNPEPAHPTRDRKRRVFFSMLRLRLSRNPGLWSRWPRHVPNPPQPDGAAHPSLTFIGHSTFLLRLPGLTLLTDPIFSARCSPLPYLGPKRVRAPGLALETLPRIDVILLSHNHYDHMDLASLRKLRKKFPEVKIVTTLGNTAYLAKKRLFGAIELDWWQSMQIGDTRITATPARHFAARTLWDRNKTLWAGFMLEHEGQKIYFAADTGYTKFFTEIRNRLGAPDLALLPIGAYEPRWLMGLVHMNPADAVQAFQDLQAKRAIGMHFGTFQLTAEAIDAPLRELAAESRKAGIAKAAFTTLDPGESTPL